ASAYAGGIVEQEHRLEFSSARQTFSPHLSQEENRRLFGAAAAPSGHGHRYALRLVLQGTVDPEHGFIVPERDCDPVLAELHRKLDHRFLNADVAELRGMPMTTECLARFIWRWLAGKLPVARIVLWENPDFFVEYGPDGMARMGITGSFHAAHRLHSPHLSDAENLTMYGICNNPRGHGHLYRVEAAIDGTIDDRTGTVFPLDRIQSGLDTALASWCFKHLDLDTSDFADKPSTSENMIHVLWPRIEKALGRPLCRLRLWETPNNRFTLRRSASTGGT
ncbi:MAG TPA: 6-carboxytetrahydropterin synthase, partial [Candidatus Deferrimicrobium sp.]|nr:6-carboxytetrahydropterin synthase [Candidatus Deferrimicrobium sp.]